MGSGPDLRDIEAVLFDLDGTLVHLNIDFGRMRAEIEALLPQYGLSMEGRSTLYVLELIEDAVWELEADDEGRARAFRREAEAAIVAIEMEAAGQAQVYPEVPELLRRLRLHPSRSPGGPCTPPARLRNMRSTPASPCGPGREEAGR